MDADKWSKWIWWGSGVLLATAVLLIALIASGLFDPQPIGSVLWTAQPVPLTLSGPERTVNWLGAPVVPAAYSMRLATNHFSGEQDVVYGLVIGSLWVGVSPLGYVEVLDGETAVLPLQPWPHVTATANEIWIDVQGGMATIRINRELLWTGETAVSGSQLGVWGQSWGETAVIHFPSVTLYGAGE